MTVFGLRSPSVVSVDLGSIIDLEMASMVLPLPTCIAAWLTDHPAARSWLEVHASPLGFVYQTHTVEIDDPTLAVAFRLTFSDYIASVEKGAV